MLATSYGLQLCLGVCVHKGDEGHERTCISRTSANCSRAVAAVLLLPLPFFFLFLSTFCFCFCSCSSLCFCFCSAVVAAFVHSIGSNKFHLCTDNATNSETERETGRQRERGRETAGECWRKTRKMSKTIMSQKFPTL